jgi:glucose/arabinose dehydrogenase
MFQLFKHTSEQARIGLSLLFATLIPTTCTLAQAGEIFHSNPDIQLEQLVKGLGIPWGMTFIGPDQLLFSERSGQLRLLKLDSLEVSDLKGVPKVVAEGQGGLLDVAAGPRHSLDGWIYFTYSKPIDGEAATTLARARLDGIQLKSWQDLLVTDSATKTRQHFGSRIAFDHKGHVFFGIGDRGSRKQAQNTGNHMGSIIRLNLDGSVPADNPFINDPEARDEIWSFGHRNPQGLIFDSRNNRLWSIEHGPRGGDEINLIVKGKNYGWPVISHGKEYWGPVSIGEGTHKAGMEQARKVYIPSIAPGSLLNYHNDAFPRWDGNLFSGALKLRHLNRVSLSDTGMPTGEERLLKDLNMRIRALAQGPGGWIYLSTDDGRIMRLRPRKP